jgi:hypothetical protein
MEISNNKVNKESRQTSNNFSFENVPIKNPTKPG